jgi:PAS domain S-box-containing protein
MKKSLTEASLPDNLAEDIAEIQTMLARLGTGDTTQRAVVDPANDVFSGLKALINQLADHMQEKNDFAHEMAMRKQAEEALAFQNVLLSAQQEAAIDGILIVDDNGKILSFNRRFVEIMSIPARLLESREDEPVLMFVTGRMVDPQGFLEKVKYLYEHRQESCRDEIFLCDGKTLDRYSVPLLGSDGRYYGRFWSFRDITERKTSEEQAKNAYQQLHDIVEFLPDATFVVDEEKRVIAWNRAIENLTGLEKHEVLGAGDYIYSIPFYGDRRPILIDLLGAEQESIGPNYKCIKKEGKTLFTEAFVPAFRNGGSRYFWATASPLLNKQGKMVGAIESIRDITEYKLAEEEKTRFDSQLEYARLIETVMNRLGHDLKTPLTPLFILLPLLKSRLVEPDLIKKVEMCIKSTVSIKNIVDKTSILVGISSGVKAFELENISLAGIVNRALDGCAEAIAQKEIVCRNLVDPTIIVQVVPAQFNELFFNLIANAAHFSSEKGVVTVSAESHAETVLISVHDDGIGLSPTHLEHVFDEFFKADESRHNLDASGLGLTICKRIIRNHHGRIWAESAGIGLGTTIKIVLNEQRDNCSI